MSVDVDLEPSIVALYLYNMYECHGAVRLCVIFEFGRVSIVGSREGLFCQLDSSSDLNAGLRRCNVVFESAYSRPMRTSLNLTFPDLLGLTKDDPNAKTFLSFSTKFATALTNGIPF